MSTQRLLAAAFLSSLLQLVLTGSAVADLTKGPYVGLEGGMAWDFSYPSGCYYYYCSYNTYNAVSYNLGYSAGAQVGYSFGGPRVEFEYNYRDNNASTIGTTAGTQSAAGTLTSSAYLVNVLYDFDTGSKWIPYVGLGLGMAQVKSNNIHSTSPSIPGSFQDGSSNDFAGQFIVGVEYAVSERVGVTLDWRGLWAYDTTYNYGIGCTPGGTTNCSVSGTTSYYYWNGALNLGVRIKF